MKKQLLRNIVKSTEVVGFDVKNMGKEDLGKIEEIMLDKFTGTVSYVVLNSGSFLGLGGKLLALPWKVLHFDPNQNCFLLDIEKEDLANAPGFDKDNWPDMADTTWAESVASYYNREKSYWE